MLPSMVSPPARPSVSLMSRKPSMSIKREGDEARARAFASVCVEAFEHDAPVRQPGQRVLRRQLADRFDAARERSA